ncbi:MAG: hypothetical protein ACSHX0_06850 [Akkermansiaceae bacterium]
MANTIDSALLPDTASDRIITILGPALAALNCFHTDFSNELVHPTKPHAIGIVLDADDAVENPTSYEVNGDSEVGARTITPTVITKPFQVTQDEVNSGVKLQTMFDINLRKIAHAILDKAMSPFTVANFGAAHIAATPADLDVDDLHSIWGEMSDLTEKNLLLSGSYFSQFLPNTRDNFDANDGSYGYDKFRFCNRFTGAGAGVVGIVADPAAAAMAARLPSLTDAVAANMIHIEEVVIPELGLTIRFCVWASMATRQTWASFDVAFGATAYDVTRGKLIATA